MASGSRQGWQDDSRRVTSRRRTSSFDRWTRWLLLVSAGLAAFGLVMALFGGTPFFGPLNALYDPPFWPQGAPVAVTEFRAWVYGAWGATIAGWGIVLLFVVRGPFAAHEAWAWRAIALGTGAWFVLDTAVSVLHGVVANVLLNMAVFALIALPLWGTRRDFR